MSIKYYVLGGPRYKPPGVSRGSPKLHFILMCMLMQLFVCCDRNKFNSIQYFFNPPLVGTSEFFLNASNFIQITPYMIWFSMQFTTIYYFRSNYTFLLRQMAIFCIEF